MNKDFLIQATNASFEAMEAAQYLMEDALTERDKAIAEALYRAHWALYWVLVDIRKRGK